MDAVSADTGFDLAYVAAVEFYVHPERPYADTRDEIEKTLRRARHAKRNVTAFDPARARQVVAGMAKYRKGVAR